MRISKDWTYRCIYKYCILINKKNNEIVQISPLIFELFKMEEKDGILPIEKWSGMYNIDEKRKSELIGYFGKKGVFIND